MKGLTEYAQRIAAEFDDKDTESVEALFAAVFSQDSSKKAAALMQAAVTELWKIGAIRIGFQQTNFGEFTRLTDVDEQKMIAEMQIWLLAGPVKVEWDAISSSYRTGFFPAILVSETGRRVVEDVRRERGFRWWQKGSGT